jgi:hypothetical protein
LNQISRLTRIASKAFSFSSLQSIEIPRNVQFIDGSVFVDVTLSSISIESGDAIFVMENDFLIDVLPLSQLMTCRQPFFEKI